ncbi:Tyrosyl-DNA phosphodiesterase [Pseudozyma hubeiensis]|nr:Tyrosyl-DNA phosphodiesterase [Pseudozyma hubeiensis]
MAGKDPIVISDSDSDTLSESERPTQPRVVQAKSVEVNKHSQASQSQHERAPTPLISSQTSTQTETSKGTESAAGTSSARLLSLLPDRRQLELERKERARKRRREQNLPSSSSDEDTQADTKRSKSSAASIPGSSSQSLASTTIYVNEPSSSKPKQIPSTSTMSASFSRATDPITPSSRFWTGTVKHSFNRYAAASLSGVTISQMLLPATASSRNSLQLAVLATYDLRMDWLYSHFPRGLPGGVTLVLPPPKEDYRYDRNVARPGLHKSEIFGGEFARCPGWQVCVPNKPKGGWLTQHMKFLILVHDTFCRVAILSGNLNEIDWERIENTAFIQDFPLLSASNNGSSSVSGTKNDFKLQLIRVLRSLSMPSSHAVYAALDKYDFSSATRARIVASWPEASSLTDWDRIETQGLGRLGKVVRDLGIKQRVEVECQGSSLANHDVKWIEHFHVLASGIEPRGRLPFKGKSNDEHPEYARLMRKGLPPVKVVFPSHKYVEERTVEGPMGALSFFGKADSWAASPIKALYHSPQSRRGDIMIHAKSILALTAAGKAVVDKAFLDASDAYISGNKAEPPPKGTWSGPKDTEQPVGWTYLGSSNFTRAAHGNISGTTAKPTMSSMNWELGVVMPIYASEVETMGVQAECLRPVVYHRPLQAYASDDGPWDNSSARALI